MTRAVLSLGSNMGDSAKLLREAVRTLGEVVLRASSLYRTAPWGPVEQDDFLNIAVLVDDPATDAAGWLARCHELERAADRRRTLRWGPRTLDADVIVVWRDSRAPLPSSAVLQEGAVLTLPHPRAHERGFVLVPWAEIEPDATLPGHGPISDLVAAMDISDIERLGPLAQAGR